MSCGGLKTFRGQDPKALHQESWDWTGTPQDSEGWDRVLAAGGTVTLGTVATTVGPRAPGTRDFTIDFAAGGSRATFRRGTTAIVTTEGIVAFEALVQVVVAPVNAGDDYSAHLGIWDTGVLPVAGAAGFGFAIDSGVSATNWLRATGDGVGVTIEDTGIAFTVGAWQCLRAVVAADASDVDFFITDAGAAEAAAGTIAATVPGAAVDAASVLSVNAVGGVGGATLVFAADWFMETKQCTPRRP